ncbi:MAG: hypothetical protein ACK559_36685 [bacterium]
MTRGSQWSVTRRPVHAATRSPNIAAIEPDAVRAGSQDFGSPCRPTSRRFFIAFVFGSSTSTIRAPVIVKSSPASGISTAVRYRPPYAVR